MGTHSLGALSTVILAVVGVCGRAEPARAQGFQGLGFMAGGSSSRGACVSADGRTVTGYGTTSAAMGDKPFRWTSVGGGGVMTDLGTLGGVNAQGSEISDDGSVVVGYSDTPSGVRAYRWTQESGQVSLGTLTGGAFSYGNGVSGDGRVVVGYGGSASGNRAFKWTQGAGMVDLGVLQGMATSLALGANADGSVVVGYSTLNGVNRACRWTSDGIDDLGVVNGYANSYGYACSADGSVVVGRVFSVGTGGQAFRWSAAEGWIEGLGTLDGDVSAFAYGVSGDGATVVGMSQGAGGVSTQRAVLWRRDLGLVDLNAYLPTLGSGFDLDGWTLTNAMDISPDGLKIVGYGVHDGLTEAWLAVLTPPAPCAADLGTAGGEAGDDGQLDNNDFIAFINYFFGHDAHADMGVAGGLPGHDGLFDNNDFIAFIAAFFNGC